MRLLRKLRRKCQYLLPEQIEAIEQAYLLAFEAHQGQSRVSGEPYITHPLAVACILAELEMDHETIMAALMHDVIEDTPVDKQKLIEKFGEQVAELVDGVSKLTQIEFITRAEAQAENFRKMVLAMSRDIRVILVKLADRLHNMRTLGALSESRKNRIGRETLEIFAPIAKRLGMHEISTELEELSFSALYPLRYRVLKESVRKARGDRKKILNLIGKALKDGLKESNLPSCTISGREKHLYSIYRKMHSKHVPFNEIMDVYAFRIIVDSVDTCYRALGVIHRLFKPVPERFKDYIAIPKANGYQSLHTSLFGPYGLPVEVQIRTLDMHRMATTGIAAHWLYKGSDQKMHSSQLRAERWVKNLLELQQSSGNSLEFIESVKVDLFPDEVYVFTPKGNIMQLPVGATAVDFAYMVHTDVGNTCVAAKIDRQLAPLSSQLSSGQTVEVITTLGARPNPAWLDFVVTSKARSGIRHFLKTQRRGESVSLGTQLLKQALANFSLSFKKLPQTDIDFVVVEAKLNSFKELLEEIGLGNRVAMLVAQRFATIAEQKLAAVREVDVRVEKDSVPLQIQGTEGMAVRFADCCHPIPGDAIVGVLTAGKGVEIHNTNCTRITKLRRHPDRCMSLRWSEHPQGEFLVHILLEVINERGVLATMALAISDAEAGVEDIQIRERDGNYYLVEFSLFVADRAHLAVVMRRLRQLKAVHGIKRMR